MFALLFTLPTMVVGQEIIKLQILGPYDEYQTHTTFHIKTKVHFADDWVSGFTETQLQERIQKIFSNLNQAFNPHRIYFLAENNACNTANGFTYHLFDTIEDTPAEIGNNSQDWLNIIDYGPVGGATGYAHFIPNNYLNVDGTDEDDNPAGHTSVLIHEVGHCFGLEHTHAEGCSDECEDPNCNCCEDFICDTPLNLDNNIQAESDCSHPTLSANLVRNYMSYVNPHSCRTLFTEDQVMRMRAYLKEAPILQPIQHTTTAPANTPETISGNIIVDGGQYTVNSTLQMLPGASIRVKPGSTLHVQSTITGACGQMWQGIIVEGTVLGAQSTTNQGRFILGPTGKIEHAKCAGEVQDIDASGDGVSGTGGGIVNINQGQLINNTVGIRFGAYGSGGAANVSKLLTATFSTTDDYRGGDAQPIYLDLNTIVQLKITSCRFTDLRTDCDNRAIGIHSKNAGFKVSLASKFENLSIGIQADKLNNLTGSYSISGATFKNCYKSIVSNGTSNFSIVGNNFKLQKPDPCPSSESEVIGVQLKDNTAGFKFSNNDFEFAGTANPDEKLIGTNCIGLGEGLNNTIRKNTYRNLDIANRAMGDNGYEGDGLYYLCNFHDEFTLSNSEPPIDYLVETGWNIRQIQGEKIPGQDVLPTGNIFSESDYTFKNLGQSIDYYYYQNDETQDLNYGVDWSGMINPEPVNQSNDNCIDPPTNPPYPEPPYPSPCDPCTSSVELAELKADFFERRLEWSSKKAGLPFITDSLELQAELDAIRLLRLGMNKDGSRILRHYELDTAFIHVDSIITWLQRIETYTTDLELARHFFFTNNFAAFGTLWSQIPGKYELQDEELDEFEELELVYETVRPHLQSGGALYKLSETITDSLHFWADWCSEPGFLSQVLLWRNGIQVETDCSEVGERAQSLEENYKPQRPDDLFKVYPNPAQDVIFIESFTNFEEGTVSLFNLQGKEIMRKHLDGNLSRIVTLQSGNLSPGFYFLKLRTSFGAIQYSKILISQ